MNALQLRRKIYDMLEPAVGARLTIANRLIITLICLSVLLAILDSEIATQKELGTAIWWAETLVACAFAAEYILRIWSAGEDPRYIGIIGRVKFMITPSVLVDLCVLLPSLVGIVGGEAFVLRFLRLMRILRLARLGRFSYATTVIYEAMRARRYELAVTVFIAGGVLLITSTLLYLAEGDAQPEIFGSIPRAMWWSIATLTTVGYGDAVPITAVGRLLAGASALLGIGLIALPAGILASAFSDVMQKKKNT